MAEFLATGLQVAVVPASQSLVAICLLVSQWHPFWSDGQGSGCTCLFGDQASWVGFKNLSEPQNGVAPAEQGLCLSSGMFNSFRGFSSV